MIKAIFFDAGGVLNVSNDQLINHDIEDALGISLDEHKEAWDKYIDALGKGIVDEEQFWLGFLKEINYKGQLTDKNLMSRAYVKNYQRQEEVLDLVRWLKYQKDIQLAILSNTVESHCNHSLSQGIYDDFKTRIFSHQVGLRKPDPRIYQLSLDKLGVKPEESLLIDDSLKNIQSAEKIGMKGIHFQSVEQLKEELRKLDIIKLNKTEGASAFVTHKGRLLMFLRDDKPTIREPNCWELVGGMVDEGETGKEAVLREIFEEANIELSDVTYLFSNDNGLGGVEVFHAEVTDEQAKGVKLNSEGQEVRFFSLEEVKRLKLAKYMQIYLENHSELIESLLN